MQAGLALCGFEGRVVEEEVWGVYGYLVSGGGDGETKVQVDGFSGCVHAPEVVYQLGGLGFGAGGRGVELQMCDGAADDFWGGTRAVVEWEAFDARVQVGGVGGGCGDDGGRAGAAVRGDA